MMTVEVCDWRGRRLMETREKGNPRDPHNVSPSCPSYTSDATSTPTSPTAMPPMLATRADPAPLVSEDEDEAAAEEKFEVELDPLTAAALTSWLVDPDEVLEVYNGSKASD